MTVTENASPPTRRSAPPPALPSTLRMGLARGGIEVKQFFRDKEAVIFTFSFPAILLFMLGSIFTDSNQGVTASMIFSASMIAYGVMSTAFIGMGVGIAADREDGTLKRLRGTPVTAPAYFIGKLILVATSTAGGVALLLAMAVLVFDQPLPSAGRWLTFGWMLALSLLACTPLGIAASAMARSSRTAAAVLNVPVVALQFLSGIFINPITQLPDWMITTASIFPVKWMGQGFRSVFLPDFMVRQEAAGAWEHDRIALVLGAWCVVGLVLCLVTFRWSGRRSG